MKKILIVLGLMVGVFANAQVLNSLDDLDSLSLDEAHTMIEDAIDQLDEIEKIAKIANSPLRIKIGPADDSEEEFDYYDVLEYMKHNKDKIAPSFLATNADSIQRVFSRYFANCYFYQSYRYPDSYIVIKDGDESNEKYLMDHYNYEEYTMSPRYKVKKLFYADGSVRDLEQEQAERKAKRKADGEMGAGNDDSYYDDDNPMKNDTRLLRAVEIEYHETPCTDEYILDAKHARISTPNGKLILRSIDGSSVEYMATDSLSQGAIVKVQGLNKFGIPMELSGGSTWQMSLPSAGNRAKLMRLKIILQNVIKHFSDYKTVSDLKDYLSKKNSQLGLTKEENIKTYNATHVYRGAIEAIAVFVKKNDGAVRRVTYENELANQDVFIAKDTTNNYGLLNREGKWIIPPSFHAIHFTGFPELNRHGFYRASSDREYEPECECYRYGTYELDRKNKRMIPLDFRFSESIIPDSIYIVADNVSNGPSGLYDLQNRKFLMPLNYVNMECTRRLLTCREGKRTYAEDGLYGGYTIYGKRVLPHEFKWLDTDGDFFYARQEGSVEIKNKSVDKSIVYDRNGNLLVPEGTYTLASFFNGLIATIDLNGHYAYYDSLGRKAIDASQYDEITSFHEGMASVRKEDKWGAINTKGELVVPIKYDEIRRFFKGFALAREDKRICLIDKEGNVAHDLGNPYSAYKIDYKDNEDEDSLEGDVVYIIYTNNYSGGKFDAYGNLIQRL